MKDGSLVSIFLSCVTIINTGLYRISLKLIRAFVISENIVYRARASRYLCIIFVSRYLRDAKTSCN